MLKIICPNCNKENLFQSRSNIPSECSFCFDSFPSSISIDEISDNERQILGLTIIYQINQERLEISILHKTILGRESFGADIFSKILVSGKQVVSRVHCSIEFKDGKFYLIDEGSTNGTFYGINKISCKNSPQVIEDKSIFYIGEEIFLGKINFIEPSHQKQETLTEEKGKEDRTVVTYRCSACGNELNEKASDCPQCDRYNTLIEIYE